jgi:hypothetical protein
VSSLGSSTARYTLSFPLLGKPKVKLEDALKEVGKDGVVLSCILLSQLIYLLSPSKSASNRPGGQLAFQPNPRDLS